MLNPPSPDQSTAADVTDDRALLLTFVHERDVECPRCGYNLRNLTQPVCPECREELRLTVGVRRLGFGLLVAALAPGIFSGIAAVFLLGIILMVTLVGRAGLPPWPLIAADIFGWCSGLVAIGLFLKRYSFLKLPHGSQTAWVAILWTIHLAMFLVVVTRMQ